MVMLFGIDEVSKDAGSCFSLYSGGSSIDTNELVHISHNFLFLVVGMWGAGEGEV
jgi:hypothetical protein